jgi:hypothetical protein
MPAPHWSLVTLAMAAAALFRRRAASTDDDPEAVAATRVPPSADELAPIQPTQQLIRSYAFVGCTDREIADRFGLTEPDLRQTFAATLALARGHRAFAIRRAQTELATGPAGGGKAPGNANMLTWLGRNELGQSLSPTLRGEAEPEFEG